MRLWDWEWEWDMDGNIVYGEGLPLEENIHQINEDLCYLHWIISNVLLCHKIIIMKNGCETLLFV